jgi:deoxycytidine triphosphate deaminase/gas vesicle protein
MAQLLNDKDLQGLFEKAIIDADADSLRPNAYILRLGKIGEFMTTGKPFAIKEGKGIILPPGHAIAVTAFETIDFRPGTIHEVYPDCSLHGFLSPTTDLSREGLTVSSTQVDAGYHGTLNWTISNQSPNDAKFVYGEKLFRLTILKLEKGEVPSQYYSGDYQDKEGYVASRRSGPPVGMKDSDWMSPSTDDSPEAKLDALIKSGYPWNLLGERLKTIDQQFETVTHEYDTIRKEIKTLNNRVGGIEDKLDRQQQEWSNALQDVEGRLKQGLQDFEGRMKQELSDTVENVVNKLILRSIAPMLGAVFGLGLMVLNDQRIMGFLSEHGGVAGFFVMLVSCLTLLLAKK